MDIPSATPPISMTSLPLGGDQDAVSPSPAGAALPPPLLASDILREEVAPLAPARAILRVLLTAYAAVFGVVGLASLAGWMPGATRLTATSALLTAAAAALAALAPAPYAARAGLATLAGLLPLVLGTTGRGALAPLAVAGFSEAAAGVVLATLLPGSLWFRARYRAFLASRGMLAGALLFALPAAFFLARGALAEGSPLAVRAADVLLLAASLTSLGGFLGPETTGGCTGWGVLILLAYTARVFVASSHVDAAGMESAAVGTIGGGLAATVVSVGLYQLLAAMLAGRARLVDVHRIVGPSADQKE